MGDAQKRIDRWKVRFEDDSAGLSPLMKKLRTSATASVETTFPLLVTMEDQVRGELNTAGEPTILFPAYFGFARQVWSLQNRGVAGLALQTECALKVAYWVGRGLTEATLNAILLNVFSVSPPPP